MKRCEQIVEALLDDPDDIDPTAYALSTLDPDIVLPALGFKRSTSRADGPKTYWLKLDPENLSVSIIVDHVARTALYRVVRLGGKQYNEFKVISMTDVPLEKLAEFVKKNALSPKQAPNYESVDDPDADIDARAAVNAIPLYTVSYLVFNTGTGAYGSGGWSRHARHRPQPTVVTKKSSNVQFKGKSVIVDGVRRLKCNVWDWQGTPLRTDYPDITFA